ncbi:DUF805 domain-containing protein [Aliidiomarina sedimenti]|uniref:DUF805 domain-containing protein n=1 Tax=Aliidiomarina sedimenti TaxID=1933879 RepID=A0ABY0BZ65_9GAMM|nr:DUF805 domain-containing protein [Aliidiomarina sedimenti]RUO30060.1 DUF805 domain-containing protein [Aliidiomarina sedimenti]
MNWYLKVLKQYAVFQGRARRKEYWMFILFNLIVSFVLGFIDGVIGTFDAEIGLGLLSGVYALAIFIPSLAVLVRRLHDTGRSGWWIFISLIPLIGLIVLLVFLVQDSNPEDNIYGSNPKAVAA